MRQRVSDSRTKTAGGMKSGASANFASSCPSRQRNTSWEPSMNQMPSSGSTSAGGGSPAPPPFRGHRPPPPLRRHRPLLHRRGHELRRERVDLRIALVRQQRDADIVFDADAHVRDE